MRDLSSDIRYAIRALAKNRGFSLTVIGVLTLGIGLNATVFTMLKGMALTPLGGVEAAASLRVLYRETETGRVIRISYPDYQYIRDNSNAFSGLMASGFTDLNVGRGRSARQVSGELVTGNYFQVLGVRAQLGRTLLPSDEVAPGRHPVVVLSDGMWRRDFAADPGIVGKTLDVNNYPLTIVGVTDPSFHGTIVSYDVEVFVPVMMAAQVGVGNPPRPRPTSSRIVATDCSSLRASQARRQRGERRGAGRRDLDGAVCRSADHRSGAAAAESHRSGSRRAAASATRCRR